MFGLGPWELLLILLAIACPFALVIILRKADLGGWLILPALGILVTPIRLFLLLLTDYLPIFSEGYWEVLTTPGSDAYHYLWAPLITFEICANAGFIVVAIVLIFMFFTKSHRFPNLFIVFLASNLFFVIIDFCIPYLIPDLGVEHATESTMALFQAAVGAIIWIPYFLVSKRVKRTFVKLAAPPLGVELDSTDSSGRD